MSRKRNITMMFPVLVVAAILSGVVTPSSGQNSVLDKGDINVTYAEILKLIDDLKGTIDSAQNALHDIRKMSLEEQINETNTLFSNLKSKLQGMLDDLGPNSVLFDNLEGAKANVIVLKRWFERQPPAYPNRDQLVARLDGTIKKYDVLSDSIEEQRNDTMNAFRDLTREITRGDMAIKVQLAEDSVIFLAIMVEKLRDLSGTLREAAGQETPPAISN